MLLTISNTAPPATDLGYLLHKHPERCQSFELSAGQAHVFYPEASAARCTAALLLDIDPVALVRSRGEGNAPLATQYVNDRPYAASSFLSVAIARVYGTALAGRCQTRPELAEAILPLEARVVPLPARGGAALIGQIFEPLGYQVEIAEAGSHYYEVTLRAETRLRDLLSHLYVLIPVLDDHKHYWIGEAEVEKLLRHGDAWLGAHPARELIVRRYLRHRRHLTRAALARLTADDEPDPDEAAEAEAGAERAVEEPLRLHEQRQHAVVAALREAGARRVLDLGCGEGRLLELLARAGDF
ncbi:MAG TPA: 3' terminal RNA ribose 2'-O-methyltransferase Hen1, partial [Thermomicrobiaceae bacterium]|nr:3' terminal RNA ribose 2'-O-methyltransferase Hen1 [Thermomicrobiaceae bacterium]